jgi:hypothetical protein
MTAKSHQIALLTKHISPFVPSGSLGVEPERGRRLDYAQDSEPVEPYLTSNDPRNRDTLSVLRFTFHEIRATKNGPAIAAELLMNDAA